jgi:oxygen-independent coproporphyrinogen-3 oxidase
MVESKQYPMTLSLYIHIPFCRQKCPYCDFASVPAEGADLAGYVAAVCREMELRSHRAPWAAADTLYLGGGTPSLLAPDGVGALIAAARTLYGLTDDVEITLEANPGTVDGEMLAAFRRTGVNRLSLGVQSFDDRQLTFLGRIHSADEARSAFRAARRAGFDNIGIDLIHTLPGQSPLDWQRQLEQAVDLAPEHVSAYGLTLEEGTPLAAAHERGAFTLPEDDTAGQLYTLTAEILTTAGYEQYEIANFARPGRRSRHNQAYWHWKPYLGFGAAAHSFTPSPHPGRRWHNPPDPSAYLAMVSEGELPGEASASLSLKEAMGEWLFLALRTSDGFRPEAFAATFGQPAAEACGGALPRLLAQGVLLEDDGRIRLAPSALPLANQVFLHFV